MAYANVLRIVGERAVAMAGETPPAPTSHAPPPPPISPRQVVVEFYAQVLESHTGPAQVKEGMFSLPIRKVGRRLVVVRCRSVSVGAINSFPRALSDDARLPDGGGLATRRGDRRRRRSGRR